MNRHAFLEDLIMQCYMQIYITAMKMTLLSLISMHPINISSMFHWRGKDKYVPRDRHILCRDGHQLTPVLNPFHSYRRKFVNKMLFQQFSVTNLRTNCQCNSMTKLLVPKSHQNNSIVLFINIIPNCTVKI